MFQPSKLAAFASGLLTISLSMTLSTSVFANEASNTTSAYTDPKSLSYSSYTFKQSSWTPSQYVGDLKDVVEFAGATAHVVEFRSPQNKALSVDVGAALRSNDDGDTEIESLLGAIEAGGIFFRIETSSSPGYINPEGGKSRFDKRYVIGERGFDAGYTQINIGKSFDHMPSARWGVGYIEATQPAEIDLYTTGSTSYPDVLIDPEYQHQLLGIWIDFDNLQAAMHDDDGFALSMNRRGALRYGWGLTMDILFGLQASKSNQDLEQIVKDNYGLDLKYEDPMGIGWSFTYRLEYILAYRRPDSNVGLSFGIEGRAFQGIHSADLFGSDDSVDNANEAHGRLGIGDNSIFQYGPFVRVAWEI
jgi:hypothetical protein